MILSLVAEKPKVAREERTDRQGYSKLVSADLLQRGERQPLLLVPHRVADDGTLVQVPTQH